MASALPLCIGDDITEWQNCEGTHFLANGDRYIGEWRNGKRGNGATHDEASGTVLITSTDGVLAMAGSTVEIDLPDTEKNSLVQRNGSLKAGILVRFAWIYLIERRLELWISPTMWPGGIKEIRNL